MDLAQKKLALQAVSQLASAKEIEKNNLLRSLENTLSIAQNGVKRNGVTVTAADLQATAGAELWEKIQADLASLQAFANEID
jgi:hypothetical protein